MGPQSGSCGYGSPTGVKAPEGEASMGPQSGSCGYQPNNGRITSSHCASMGPQSGSCGYMFVVVMAPSVSSALQWVHSLVAVVIPTHSRARRSRRRFNGSTVW